MCKLFHSFKPSLYSILFYTPIKLWGKPVCTASSASRSLATKFSTESFLLLCSVWDGSCSMEECDTLQRVSDCECEFWLNHCLYPQDYSWSWPGRANFPGWNSRQALNFLMWLWSHLCGTPAAFFSKWTCSPPMAFTWLSSPEREEVSIMPEPDMLNTVH